MRLLLGLVEVLPLAWGRGLGVGLARLARRLRPADVAVARANLARAFPDTSAAARERLLAAAVDHLGINLFHTLAAPRLVSRPDVIATAPASASGDADTATVLAGLAAEGRGVFILTGHIGCWELAGAWVARELASRGLGPLGVVTGTVHNPPVDDLLQGRRRDLGMQPLPRDGGVRPLLALLRRGGVVAVLLDQRTGVRNLPVPFFGVPAPTPLGPARIALRHGIPVLPVVGVWDAASRRHVMHHLPPLRPDAAGGETAAGFLARCNGALETFVRRNPAQWVWFHRRWSPDT
ncbi:lysophospholipid acyltransferase family protein [bacterium]|nr:lysophospholipid acyltransferase family protein [bacterium]